VKSPAAVTLAVAVALVFAAPAAALCPDQTTMPFGLTPQTAKQALLCAINEQRAAAGLPPFTEEPHLEQAARGHSLAMRKQRFFGHGDVSGRIRRSGYGKGAQHYHFGEALHWGQSYLGSPLTALQAFLKSKVHRADVFSASFRDVGIGVAIGSPVTGRARNSAIYTVDFGFRT
jgi:uncharacterized protein YkwD